MKETIEAEIVDENQIVLKEIKYPVSTTDLEELLEEYRDIPNIDPNAEDALVGEQYQFVLRGHKAFVKARNQIEKTRKELKAPALDYGKSVDGIAKEFQLKIKGTEDKLQFQRKLVEDNEARKQAEAEELEEARIDAIKNKILDIKNLALVHFNSDSESLTKVLEALIVPNEEMYSEFLTEAREVQQIAIMQLQEMRKSKVLAEKAEELEAERIEEAQKLKDEQDAKLQTEKDALAKQQAEFQKQKEDFERQQREQQEVLDRQEAEKVANELQEKQEIERLEKENESKELFDKKYNEAYDDLEKALKNKKEALLDLIIDGKIRNVKWEA